jgi:hypothetical protein
MTSALLSHHQRSFLLQQMRANAETPPPPQPDITHIVRDCWDTQLLIKSLPSGLREHNERGGRKSVRARGDGGHQAFKALCINMNKAHTTS